MEGNGNIGNVVKEEDSSRREHSNGILDDLRVIEEHFRGPKIDFFEAAKSCAYLIKELYDKAVEKYSSRKGKE